MSLIGRLELCASIMAREHNGQTIHDAITEITRLEAVNAELASALAVFADPSNWGYDRDLPRAWDNREIRRPSDFARNALAKAAPATLQPRAADASIPPES